MVLLDWISLSSFFLAACALSAMCGLILHRSLKNWQARRESARSGWLTNLALEYLEQPGDVAVLKSRLKRGDRQMLVSLMTSMLAKVSGEYAGVIVELMRALGVVEDCLHRVQARGWWERARACADLGSFNEPRVVVGLYKALEDPAVEVRVAAARSLIRLGEMPPVRTLLASLAVGQEIRSLAVNDLFRSLGSEAAAELIAVIEGDAPHSSKLLAIDALGSIGDLRAVPPLVRLSRHPLPRVRAAIFQALGRLVDPRSVPAVLRGLTDSAWEVRAQAAIAASRLGSLEVLCALERRLEDNQWWVRYHAAEAMFTLGGDGLVALQLAATGVAGRASEIARGLLREKGMAA